MRLIPPRERSRQILTLGTPIAAGMVSGTVLELVDLAFVGHLGTHALAAVGLGGFVGWIYISLFFGLGIAVLATSSRQIGSGHSARAGGYLNAALATAFTAGPLVSWLLVLAAPVIFELVTTDPIVVSTGTPYLQWIFASAPLIGASVIFGQYWNAIGRPQYFMRVSIVQNLLNIPFNYVFIFGHGDLIDAHGAAGAGMGTFGASVVGVLLHVYYGLRHARPFGFLTSAPHWTQAVELVRLGVPGTAQQVLESLALTLNYRIVGMVGTPELAVYAVLMHFISFVGLPAFALGTAGAALVGQSLGRGDPDAAYGWAWDTVKVGVLTMTVLGLPLWLAPRAVLSIFVREAATTELAIAPMMVLGLMIGINGISYMMSAILNGAGDVNRVLAVSLASQYLILIPLGYLVGPVLGYGLIGMWLVHQFCFRAAQSGIYTWMWQRRGWVDAFRTSTDKRPETSGEPGAL
jgi:putative MATE family efflux protein